MNESYRTYHPKWYRRRVPIYWWTRQLSYSMFISRELTSLGVAYGAVLLLAQLWAASAGDVIYSYFLRVLMSPPIVVVNLVVLVALLFHSFTWLNLAPKALVLDLGGRRIPESVVLLSHYLAWIVASGFVVWFLSGGLV